MTPHAQPMTAEQIERIRAAAADVSEENAAVYLARIDVLPEPMQIMPNTLIALCALAAKGLDRTVTDAMVERAAMAMVSAWDFMEDGKGRTRKSRDWLMHWNEKQDRYRKQARAAIEAALSDQSKGLAAQEGDSAPIDSSNVYTKSIGDSADGE